MRNYSTITTNLFQSFDINVGEYSQTVKIDDVVQALAVAFQTEPAAVHEAFRQICVDGVAMNSRLCRSEESVLIDLYEFAKGTYVPQAGAWGQSTRVFSYHNINTGATVMWVDFRA